MGILSAVKQAAPSLHKAGTFSTKTFDVLINYLAQQKISYSVETGSGASTLLFSHFSKHHTVFALDNEDGSISNIRENPLLQKNTITFVQGPTQKTLPFYQFKEPLQAALIDGPHGYPFPDLEYYYIYPHLEADALLVVDDIHIRSIHNLFSFLKSDKMFHLERVVERTAFFRRTTVTTFDPLGDGWWEQGYNQRPPLPFMPRHLMKQIVPKSLIRILRSGRR